MTASLGRLMEDFVARSRESTVPSSHGPVQVNDMEPLPVVPTNRWMFEDRKKLRKRYHFDTMMQRNTFVFHLLEYETLKHHSAEIKITEDWVELVVQTKDMDTVTDLDKEYAKYADMVYKDVCYIPAYEPR